MVLEAAVNHFTALHWLITEWLHANHPYLWLSMYYLHW